MLSVLFEAVVSLPGSLPIYVYYFPMFVGCALQTEGHTEWFMSSLEKTGFPLGW